MKTTKKCIICGQVLFLSCFPKYSKTCKACRAAKYRGLYKHQSPKKTDQIKQLEAWINTPPLRYFPDTGDR